MANDSLRASIVYRRPMLAAPTARALAARFPHTPSGSLRALLSQAGPFQASGGPIRLAPRDAFQFSNRGGWKMTEQDARVLRKRFEDRVDVAKLIGLDGIRNGLRAIRLDVNPVPAGPALPVGLPEAAINYVIEEITGALTGTLLDKILAGVAGDYGRCGGMAFAALDYFLIGQDVPNNSQQPDSGPLRDFIWRRLLDSLDLNVVPILEWVMQLHIMPVISKMASAALGSAVGTVVAGPVGTAIGAYLAGKEDVLGLGGPKVLVERTRGELNQLRTRLLAGPAWPIGLIYDDSAFVWKQHQVLALRFRDLGSGRLQLDVWDNNDGRRETSWVVDPSGSELQVTSPDDQDHRIKGIICEEYHPAIPPLNA